LLFDGLVIRLDEAGEKREIHQTEIKITVDRFSLAELQPLRLKHPAYTTLLSKKLNPDSSSITASSSSSDATDEDGDKEVLSHFFFEGERMLIA